MLKVGDTVRIKAPGEFEGWEGKIVRISRRRATNTIGLYIPAHPWSKPENTVWWFDKRELSFLPSHASGAPAYLMGPSRPAAWLTAGVCT
jgi:hypothetical protein